MAHCELTEKCVFFNGHMAGMPSTADMLKNLYCLQDFDKCARYMIVKELGREKVPADLFPNQIEKARSILQTA